ncbi:hypothetical protein [Thiocystis violacea]|uniref:hypothetical protein n=1 Tax=Thiocystis violacea TaxID=13725 RepID=UPI0019046F3D|nr:hypothetical protein [Thiocystis violacea]MBK1719062.1 hypothetical protein [Thiocystis violacea]
MCIAIPLGQRDGKSGTRLAVAIPPAPALASLAESGLPRDLGVALLGLPLVLIGGLFLASRTELA